MQNEEAPIALAFTGASGALYGLRLLECLLAAGRAVYLMYSQPAQMVMAMETEVKLPSRAAEAEACLSQLYSAKPGQLRVFAHDEWMAPVASGTNPPAAMVICPCTTGTLATIASGLCQDLIDRAADVMLKERKKLILVLRETPLSDIHLENMLKLSRMGAIMMPANPGFYLKPERLSDLVDFMVARVLDHLQVPHDLIPRWGETNPQG
ncbi:MAG: UbiX family flavin prenyltransferase [gamma proteobacterium symbiont of Bathyaustriella thionipta]|nr:UbiX family flavin prenyltransferase [gamma proteobacterium symbiont of Bathyaustriella thionipta]